MDDVIESFDPISAEDLAAFHAAKGVRNSACERCGTSNWHLSSADPEAPAAALPTTKDSGQGNVAYFIALIVLSCANCGNTWITNRAMYEYWVKTSGYLTKAAEARESKEKN